MGGKHTLTYLYLKPPPQSEKKNCNNNGDVNGLIWKPREHNSFHTSAPLFNYAVVMCRWTPVLRDRSLFVVFTVRPVVHMHVPNTSSHARSRSVSHGRCAWEAPSLWCSQWRSERCVCARRVHALHANLTCSKPTHSFFVALLASFSSLKIFPVRNQTWILNTAWLKSALWPFYFFCWSDRQTLVYSLWSRPRGEMHFQRQKQGTTGTSLFCIGGSIIEAQESIP